MIKTAPIAACIGLATALAAPVMAQRPSEDWWLVYGQDGAATAHFVNLTAIKRTRATARAEIITVDRAGGEKRRSMTVACAEPQAARSLPAFLCGTNVYRMQNGLNIRDFPRGALARLYFDAHPQG